MVVVVRVLVVVVVRVLVVCVLVFVVVLSVVRTAISGRPTLVQDSRLINCLQLFPPFTSLIRLLHGPRMHTTLALDTTLRGLQREELSQETLSSASCGARYGWTGFRAPIFTAYSEAREQERAGPSSKATLTHGQSCWMWSSTSWWLSRAS